MSSILEAVSTEISQFKLVDPKNSKAVEWKHFKKYDPKHKRASMIVCMICRDKEEKEAVDKKRKINHVAYEVPYDSSTTKLRRHLSKEHKDISNAIQAKKANTISSDMS